ncbi:MAG: Do family serine endopeptidase [Alphaproteobacteria bacterium]|nr:Do family serine endopeptidase [Alphaproteobacteria bacterium]
MRTLGAILWIFAGLALAACDGSDETGKTGGKPAPQVAGEVAADVIVAGGLPTDPARGNLPTLAPLVDAVAPGVVNIATTGTVTQQFSPLFDDPFFRRFFNLPNQIERHTRSVGSGVIIDAAQGYVITNHHVIAQADEIIVTTKDRREFEAKLIGSDPATDVAVLQIAADGLVEIALGESDAVRVGDFVIAIGNPFGLGQTVTTGIVSALGRSQVGIGELEDFIQTDAAINPGNSGGALIDLRGKLIGINTAMVGPSGGNVGIGFAIPTDLALVRMGQLIEHGEVRRGLLGVQIQDVTPAIAEALGLEEATGAIVAEVVKGSAADQAGIIPGDLILKADGETVRDGADLRNIVGLTEPGTEMELEILRRGDAETVEVVVGEAEKRRR